MAAQQQERPAAGFNGAVDRDQRRRDAEPTTMERGSDASMEPLIVINGDAQDRRTRRSRSPCFNGAVDRDQRRLLAEAERDQLERELQWSR